MHVILDCLILCRPKILSPSVGNPKDVGSLLMMISTGYVKQLFMLGKMGKCYLIICA